MSNVEPTPEASDGVDRTSIAVLLTGLVRRFEIGISLLRPDTTAKETAQ